MQSRDSKQKRTSLQSRVVCPHCWHQFAPEAALYVSQHPDLIGDVRLGSDAAQRFLPSRFDVQGAALDARGFACHEVACPHCHLTVPRPLFEVEPVFLSILGAPSSGKSYFLSSMTWRLRTVLPQNFAMSFGDADPQANLLLQQYEQMQFLNPDQDQVVQIAKTGEQGDWYDEVNFDGQNVRFVRPYLFALNPLDSHPNAAAQGKLSRVICLYDNAGEHFLPGSDKGMVPVTRHLSLSRAFFFLFDPTQDPRFRRACNGKTDDPQMLERSQRTERETAVRQETILLEAAQRVRRYAGLGQKEKFARPLIIIVPKFDCWNSLFEVDSLPDPWKASRSGISMLDVAEIERYSHLLRELLFKLTPEFVSAAEGFASHVVYIPVTATGCSPTIDTRTGVTGFRPRDTRPQWAEVPLLYVLARYFEGIIPVVPPAGDAKKHTTGNSAIQKNSNGSQSSIGKTAATTDTWSANATGLAGDTVLRETTTKKPEPVEDAPLPPRVGGSQP